MAENWLMFSEVMPRLTSEEETWLRQQLSWIAVQDGAEIEVDQPHGRPREKVDWVGPRFLKDYENFDPTWDQCGFEHQFQDDSDAQDSWGRHLWVYSEEYGEPNKVTWLMHKFLQQFRPEQSWSLTWSISCSKPRVGEFSGGAMFVTAQGIVCDDAHLFIHRQQETSNDAVNKAQDHVAAHDRRYLLYDFDAGNLVSTQVYASYDAAVEDAGALNDVMIVPLNLRVAASAQLDAGTE